MRLLERVMWRYVRGLWRGTKINLGRLRMLVARGNRSGSMFDFFLFSRLFYSISFLFFPFSQAVQSHHQTPLSTSLILAPIHLPPSQSSSSSSKSRTETPPACPPPSPAPPHPAKNLNRLNLSIHPVFLPFVPGSASALFSVSGSVSFPAS